MRNLFWGRHQIPKSTWLDEERPLENTQRTAGHERHGRNGQWNGHQHWSGQTTKRLCKSSYRGCDSTDQSWNSMPNRTNLYPLVKSVCQLTKSSWRRGAAHIFLVDHSIMSWIQMNFLCTVFIILINQMECLEMTAAIWLANLQGINSSKVTDA